MDTKTTASGVAMAMAAAGLLAGCSGNPLHSSASAAPAGKVELAHCYGVNKCAGHNDCKTAANACKGQASCKGHGFVAMPPGACADVGGTVKDAWRGEVAKADLVHCAGVNKCAGHNDCKTAANACKGHASCKGQGFVAMPEGACEDIGGEAG
ncbi:MAG: hypothetical protein PVF91_06475 [Chromatiales bacterium]|jgi:hypothetical protein